MVSLGYKKDIIIGTILEPSFFCSAESEQTLEQNYKIKTQLPRMLPGEDSFAF